MTATISSSSQNISYKAEPSEATADFKIFWSSWIPTLDSSPFKNWTERSLSYLDGLEATLDENIPNLIVSKDHDEALLPVLSELKQFKEFNEWLLDHGQGDWHEQFKNFLYKLPVKVGINILSTLYDLLRITINVPCYILVHPLKSPIKLIKLLIHLTEAMTHPSTLSSLGIGILGTGFGHTLVTGHPLSVLAMGIGGALWLTGISLSTVKVALLSEKKFLSHNLKAHFVKQTEDFIEGVCTGMATLLLIEGVHKMLRLHQQLLRAKNYNDLVSKLTRNWARQQAGEFIEKHGLSKGSHLHIYDNTFTLVWDPQHLHNNPLKDLSSEGIKIIKDQVIVGFYPEFVTDSNGALLYTNEIPILASYPGYQIPLIKGTIPPVPPLAKAIRLNDKIIPFIGAEKTLSSSLSKK